MNKPSPLESAIKTLIDCLPEDQIVEALCRLVGECEKRAHDAGFGEGMIHENRMQNLLRGVDRR